jgi:hypothetical protein
MAEIGSLISQLAHSDRNKRYDACEELRVMPTITPEALTALQNAANDQDPLVSEAAQRALAAHTSSIETFGAQQPPEGPPPSPKSTASIIVPIVLVLGVLVFAILCCTGNLTRPTSNTTSIPSTWSCTQYEGEYSVVFIDGTAEVYSGIDEPTLSSVKGHVTGGAGGIEAQCSLPGAGTYYRLRGVDWWGWVDADDTHR